MGQEESLEKEMATHCSLLVREIPWTEEPGGLQSMGSQNSQTGLNDSTTTTILQDRHCAEAPTQNLNFMMARGCYYSTFEYESWRQEKMK